MTRIDLFHPVKRQEPATIQDYICVVAYGLALCTAFAVIAAIIAIIAT